MKRHVRCRYSSLAGIHLDLAHPGLPLRGHNLGPKLAIEFEPVAIKARCPFEIFVSGRGIAYLPREVADDQGVGRGARSAEPPCVLRVRPRHQPAEDDRERPPA